MTAVKLPEGFVEERRFQCPKTGRWMFSARPDKKGGKSLHGAAVYYDTFELAVSACINRIELLLKTRKTNSGQGLRKNTTPKQFEELYLGKFEPHPFARLSYFELVKIEKDQSQSQEDRRTAKQMRLDMEDKICLKR